jgi:heme/copper-type cytochrome/quinol oxidase subunit 2
MRLEGWHVMVLLAMLVMIAVVIVVVTLIVLWTVRRTNDGAGPRPS